MSQKTNPNIFRLGKTKTWNSQYFEKKSTETSIYAFKILEIKKFINKFFKDNGIIISNCKVHYLNENSLHIFVSYFLTFNSKNKTLLINKKQYTKFFKNKIRINLLTKFFKSLHLFINKKINIFLTVQQLKVKTSLELNYLKKIKLLKKKLVNLKKYEQNNFFKEGINTLFICATHKNSANLLAKFIAIQLQKMKRHKFFLTFIKTALLIFTNSSFSNLQGIKIKIKGRFNGAPRAKHKIINIRKGVPNLTINAKIDYSEETSYTSNGTFGVKIWTCKK